jgi:hypothetical protein
MTQLQFDMINKIIRAGAPVLADELCSALNDFVVNYNTLSEAFNSLQQAASDAVAEPETVEIAK